MEDKEELINFGLKEDQTHESTFQEYDCDLEECHVEVLYFIAAESHFIEHLEQLEDLLGTTEPVMSHTSDQSIGRVEVRSISEVEHLSRKLSQVQDSLTKVKRVVLVENDTDM